MVLEQPSQGDKEGFNLILTARSEDKLKSLSESLVGSETDLVIADLSESRSINKLIKEVDNRGTSIEIIVNNAGMTTEGPFHESKEQDIDKIITLNMTATVKITHHFIKAMKKEGPAEY